ncbi:MAG: lactate utilization protein [Anaerolineaceae bacterium]|nr:lactate utilization protein [Anaerolineaceae bacterium]
MPDSPFESVIKKLESRGFKVAFFETKEEAKTYLLAKLQGQKLGFGGSMSLRELGLSELLPAAAQDEKAETYLLSANALAETGEIINIDGTGNRIGAAFFGPQNLIYVIGRNKLRPDLASAVDRARNIASPLNAKRLHKDTPCVHDLKCHDCDSPQRICRGMAITARPMKGFKTTELVLINQDLGF